jgi:hypothetical protein
LLAEELVLLHKGRYRLRGALPLVWLEVQEERALSQVKIVAMFEPTKPLHLCHGVCPVLLHLQCRSWKMCRAMTRIVF